MTDKCSKCAATSGDNWTQCKGACPMPMSPYFRNGAPFYVHHNGAASFVKEGEFFRAQHGLAALWGQGWTPVSAVDLEQARGICDDMHKRGEI